MIDYKPELIVINEAYPESVIVKNVRNYYPDVPVQWIPNRFEEEKLALNQNQGRKMLLLTEHRGRFFKLCPAFDECYTCCNLYTLNITQNCPYACSYCFLQEYMNKHAITQFLNVEAALEELTQLFATYPHKFFRISTEELADCLAIDPATGLNEILIDYFSKQDNAVLEFRSKSSQIDHLLNLPNVKNTVCSWSIGASQIQQEEEHKTATQLERVQAAAKAAKAGYGVAFHFDPMIYFEGWQKDYLQTIEWIAQHVPTSSILWFSFGALRFAPAQRHAMRENFPKTKLLQGELLPHPDGKMRYPDSLRLEMYQWMQKQLQHHFPQAMQYLCMEDAAMWKKVFPQETEWNNSKVSAAIAEKSKSFFNKVAIGVSS